jgi:hypothetical protein
MAPDERQREIALRAKAQALALLIVLGFAGPAGAVSMTLGGSGPDSNGDAAQALYASDSGGNSVLITQVGRESPAGAAFTEIGVPQMAPDGRVLFGAEETEMDGRHRWGIFVGDPEAPPARRVAALGFKPSNAVCFPHFRTDPYPVADADGGIAFIAADSADHDALFLRSHGIVTCLASIGGQTIQGHTISVLSHGSVQMGESGNVVFTGWLKAADGADPRNDRQALFLASMRAGVNELAVEDDLGPNRTRYKRPFGLPAAVASPEGTLVAFTAKTETGSALFLYRDGVMARILPTGTATTAGPVSYLSPGRPGLMEDATTAVLAGCARVPAIFRLERGRLNLRIERGQLTPLGTAIEALGDPVLTRSGAMFIGATDSQDHEKLFVLDGDDALFEVGSTSLLYRIAMQNGGAEGHSIFTGTLTANQRGDFAYLGSK